MTMTIIEIQRPNGRCINYRVRVDGSGPALMLLHGFTGSGAVWDGVTPSLAAHYRVIRPDLLGHGETDAPEDPDAYEVEWCAWDIGAVARALGCNAVALHGYSMGGRVALYYAEHWPETVQKLSLESTTAGLRDAVEREARIKQDEQLAQRIMTDGVESFIEWWEGLPLFDGLIRLSEEVKTSLRDIRSRQRGIGLANSLRGMGTGRQPSVWGMLGRYRGPRLVMTGSLDHKFEQIGDEMANMVAETKRVSVEGAGHTVHLEQPEVWLRTVLGFMASGG